MAHSTFLIGLLWRQNPMTKPLRIASNIKFTMCQPKREAYAALELWSARNASFNTLSKQPAHGARSC